ncbi:hypothetical protein ACFLYR_02345 [Chloroflexota bacterium]
MSKRLKMLTASLLLASIMIVTLAGAAFAERDYGDKGISNWENNTPLECPDRTQDPV